MSATDEVEQVPADAENDDHLKAVAQSTSSPPPPEIQPEVREVAVDLIPATAPMDFLLDEQASEELADLPMTGHAASHGTADGD